jgi:hypothetical protein
MTKRVARQMRVLGADPLFVVGTSESHIRTPFRWVRPPIFAYGVPRLVRLGFELRF